MLRQRRLMSFLRDRVGDGVRAVGVYDADGVTLVHARDDVPPDRTRDILAETHRNLRRGDATETKLRQSLGGVVATLQLREDGVVLHLADGDEGALVMLERFVAQDLDLFVRQCAEQMTDDE